jgi:hypothetical protein
MKQPTQPELLPPHRGTDTITVPGTDLAATEKRLREIGAVVLGFSVKGATYTLKVIMPPGEMLAKALERER